MFNIVAGPYQEGLDLETLFNFQTGADKSPDRADDPTIFETVLDVPPNVHMTSEWVERQKSWDWDATKAILVSENDLKHWETDYPLRDWPLEVFEKKDFIAGPDSLEEEPNSIEIARWKDIIGLVQPVQDATPKEVSEAIGAIGARDRKHVLVLAEDRELMLPKILKKSSVWNDVKNMQLVCECFEEGAEFPGKRINELQNAVGGVANLLHRLQRAKEELRAEGIKIPDTHTSRATYSIRFLEYDENQPLPKEGIFISAIETERKFRDITQADLDREAAGEQLDLNDFDIPVQYQGLATQNGNPYVMNELRSDRDNDYFKKEFVSALAMRAFASLMRMVKLASPRSREFGDEPGAKIISNLNMGEFATGFDKGDKIGSYRRVRDAFKIRSHEDLERAFLHGNGTVVEKWPETAPRGVDQTVYNLEQRLIARMVIANRTTLKPLGDAGAKGRPLMINRSVQQTEMTAFANAMKFRTVTSNANHIFKTFSDEDNFTAIMSNGQWDTDRKKKIPNPEETEYHNMMDARILCDTIDQPHLGYVDAVLGSASSHLKSGNEDAEYYSRESAKKTITMTNGGGGHFIMGKFIDGPIQAMKEGSENFLCLLSRVPIASRKEGSLKPLLRKHGLELEHGDHDQHYMAFGDEKFHSMTFDHMGERQHAIIGPAHTVTSFIGGAGTEYEYYAAMYHNLMVETRGAGIFPGFDNDQKKRVVFVNSEVPNGEEKTGYYDALKNSFSEKEKEILNLHFYDTPAEALDARNQHAAELGFDLDAPRGSPASYGMDDPNGEHLTT